MIELSTNDNLQLDELGISQESFETQIKQFKEGVNPVQLTGAATINKGIVRLSNEDTASYAKYFKENSNHVKLTRFVPASGAASRMFKAFYQFLETGSKSSEVEKFADNFQKFAFYNNMKCESEPDFSCAINNMINVLKLAELPKALIPFHQYDYISRTAFEEHLIEAAMASPDQDEVNVHFTISKEHQEKFNDLMQSIRKSIEEKTGKNYNISFSYQSHSTDTVAVNTDNVPFRNTDGSLLFRPGGHGSLIQNLNNLDAGLIFVKNIDNIQPDHMKTNTMFFKKALSGYLLTIQKKVSNYLTKFDSGTISADEVAKAIQSDMDIKLPDSFNELSEAEKQATLINKLDRPIRICGMVKNEGEPGGGPFWTRNSKGEESLQIVESSQIDLKNEEQSAIVKQATHFNPVDLVCWTKNYKGEKFDLKEYVDPETSFISEKSQNGQVIKVLEHPGLWNGAMANWLTIFIEVPVSTFSPVKTIVDLLRAEHQPLN
ncbi:MAG: DUF4301 family protein [Bacteroidota bacterium]